MNPFALSLVLVSALSHAVWNFFLKRNDDKDSFVFGLLVFSSIFVAPIFFVYEKDLSFSRDFWICVAASGLLKAFYYVFLSMSYDRGDLSLAYPIARSAPLLVVVWAFLFFDERLTLGSSLGILAICAGVYILHLESLSMSDLLLPLRSIRSRPSQIALCTAFFVSLYTIVDKEGITLANRTFMVGEVGVGLVNRTFAFLCPMLLATTIAVAPYVLFKKGAVNIFKKWRRDWKSILSCSILDWGGYLVFLFAMALSKVSYVISVRQISIVFGVLLGCLLLNEKYGKIRFAASMVICAGVVLVGLSK